MDANGGGDVLEAGTDELLTLAAGGMMLLG